MKSIYLILVIVLILTGCNRRSNDDEPSAAIDTQAMQETQQLGNEFWLYIEIENTRIYLKKHHQGDVEALLGTPQESIFFESGEINWVNFTSWRYDDDLLWFVFSENGYIFQIFISSDTNHRVFLPYGFGPLETLYFNDIKAFSERLEPRSRHIRERSIFLFKEDTDGDTIFFSFRFDDNLRLTWVLLRYDTEWGL